MRDVIGGILYDTEKATLVAHDRYWDGSNHERNGRNTYLYKGSQGHFFLVHETCWNNERDSIEPLAGEEPKTWWDLLPVKACEYEKAFGEVPEPA